MKVDVLKDKRITWIPIAIDEDIDDGVHIDFEQNAKFIKEINAHNIDIKSLLQKQRKENVRLTKKCNKLKKKLEPFINSRLHSFINKYIYKDNNGKLKSKR